MGDLDFNLMCGECCIRSLVGRLPFRIIIRSTDLAALLLILTGGMFKSTYSQLMAVDLITPDILRIVSFIVGYRRELCLFSPHTAVALRCRIDEGQSGSPKRICNNSPKRSSQVLDQVVSGFELIHVGYVSAFPRFIYTVLYQGYFNYTIPRYFDWALSLSLLFLKKMAGYWKGENSSILIWLNCIGIAWKVLNMENFGLDSEGKVIDK